MKHISKLLRSLGGLVVASASLFVVSALPSHAFINFTTNGSMTTGSSSSGGGAVGTLQQVLDAGNSATQNIVLSGIGNFSTLNSTGTITSANGNFQTLSATGQFVCNGTNATCSIGQTNGTGGSLTINSGGDTTFTTWNGSAFTSRITIEGNQAAGQVGVLGALAASSTAGSSLPTITATGTVFINGAGTLANPAFRIVNDSGVFTGWYSDTSGSIAHSANGISAFIARSSGVFVNTILNPFTDRGTDIGSVGNRMDDGWFGGTVTSTFSTVTNASSTFFLSGASALISTVAPIPTSTSLLTGTIPSQFYAFNASTTNCVYWTPGTLRGAWNATNVAPTVTWVPSATGTGAVVWRLAAMSLADNTYIGNAFTGTYSYATGTVGNALFRQIDAMDNLTVQSAAANVPIRWEMCRIGGQVGDTYGADAYMEVVTGKYSTPMVGD